MGNETPASKIEQTPEVDNTAELRQLKRMLGAMSPKEKMLMSDADRAEQAELQAAFANLPDDEKAFRRARYEELKGSRPKSTLLDQQ